MRIGNDDYTYENPCLVLGLPDKGTERGRELEKIIRSQVQSVHKDFSFEIVFGELPDQLKSEVKQKILEILNR
jgi:hypothetical protein